MLKLLNGDCMKLLPSIPSHSVDMILSDLPYGTTRNKWDTPINLSALWKEYERVIKDNGVIVLFAQTPFDKILGSSNIKLLKYEWIWQKTQGTGHLNAKKMPLKKHENILVFYKHPPKFYPQMTEGKPYKAKSGRSSSNYDSQKSVITQNDGWRYPTSVLSFNSDKGLHPTQKPVALCEYLIKTYTNEGETVLDNCMGSGTAGVAAVRIDRNFIGIEKNLEYYKLAKRRIDGETKK